MFAGVLMQGVEERRAYIERRITKEIPHASPELSERETKQRNIADI